MAVRWLSLCPFNICHARGNCALTREGERSCLSHFLQATEEHGISLLLSRRPPRQQQTFPASPVLSSWLVPRSSILGKGGSVWGQSPNTGDRRVYAFLRPRKPFGEGRWVSDGGLHSPLSLCTHRKSQKHNPWMKRSALGYLPASLAFCLPCTSPACHFQARGLTLLKLYLIKAFSYIALKYNTSRCLCAVP